MNRVLPRIGAVALVAIATVAVTTGSVGAAVPRQPSSPTVRVEFRIRGDLASVDGRLGYTICVDQAQPSFFRVDPFSSTRVDVVTKASGCHESEANWRLETRPKSAQDPPETTEVRLRYAKGKTTVEFLHSSKDLRWVARVLSPEQVVIEATGK